MKFPVNPIIKAWLLSGTLDILAAFVLVVVRTGKNPLIVLSFIASALFGKDAYAGGAPMQIVGLVCHYFIALSFTVFFFLIYPGSKALRYNTVLTAMGYGLFVWCIMNLIVVPSTQIPERPFDLASAMLNMGILMVCIGLPLSLIAGKHYKNLQGSSI